MGTVGISFGSPTSGAGFDVSSTVAQIVGNLKNVESPWNTQLTALQSQDTSISSLGTLFSSLSNDMSSLTNAEGILSEKTGSSSDTNVLSLTAANSNAVAGTHTVEVTNLATTSSGYLAPITNAADTLTGSITLQVGTSGATETIALGAAPSTPAANTIYTGKGVDTLAGLAAAINTSGVGIDASVLTDASGSRLSLVSGTSGSGGNISINSNSIADTSHIASPTLSYTGAADSTSGKLAAVANAGDTLSGTITIQTGSNAATNIVIGAGTSTGNTIYTGSGVNTLAGLASAITAAGAGVTASVVNNSLSLSLTGGTTGTLAVTSGVVDTYSALGYTSSVAGANANMTVDGVNLTSASNTVANLIPGVTFQLLAPSTSGAQVQVVIGNDNTDVESTVNQFVTDYNSLISAMNTQEGNTSSGTPEPLFGSPTLSLLQQQLMSGVNTESPNGYLDSIKNSSDALTGSITVGVSGGLPLEYVAGGSAATSTTGTLTAVNASDTLSGSISIQAGTGTTENIVIGAAPGSPAANTIYTGSGINTLAGLASAISGAGIGVTASLTNNILSLASGTNADLTVTSNIADTTAQTVNVPTTSGNNNLAGLAGAINAAGIGVTANVVTNSTGSQLVLVSDTEGSSGALTVASAITDQTTSTSLKYNNSGSDINSLTTLGISVNNDGTLTLDATSLDSVLNSDYTGVVGFFQNANSWGQTFSNMLTDSGTTAGTGVLALASSSNSNIESTLNADISKENMYISAQQTSLTAELDSANEIMQQLPSQLDGVNELYSAITGYNQNSGG